MIRQLWILLLFLLMPHCVQALAASGGARFSNPVFAYDWPDPTVWQGDDGRYYSFSTAGATYHGELGGFLYSEDMVHWDTLCDVFVTRETVQQLHTYGSDLWAPQVVRIGGRWLMYVTCYSSEKQSAIAVLSFDHPSFPSAEGKAGPWKFERIITDSRVTKISDTIDPFVFEDPATHRVWMYFGSTDGNYRVELASDGCSLAQGAEYVPVAGLKVAEDGTRGKVFEGAYLYHRAPYWYYFVSSGRYADWTYAIKVGRSTSAEGPFVDKHGNPMTEGFAEVLMSTPNEEGDFWGPGHNAEIFTDARDRTYIYYHSHAKASGKKIRRSLMLQQILWDKEGWPYVVGHQPQVSEQSPDLDDYTFELVISGAHWATVYLPALLEVPTGLEFYEARVGETGRVELTPVTTALANHPYLVHAAPGKYHLRGHRATAVDRLSCGDLVGSHEQCVVPQGAYVLQYHEGEGCNFYRVMDSNIQIQGGHAYMVLPQSMSGAPIHLDGFDDEEAAINEVEQDSAVASGEEFFSFEGLPLQNQPTAGVYFVRSEDGRVRKRIVR